MRRVIVAFLIAVMGSALVFGCAKGYESQKTADDLTITLSVARYPLVKGDNTLHVRVADMTGKAVTGAQASVRFYMPPMPGMAPMEFSTQGALEGHPYTFSVNVPMEGGWKAEVSVTRPGKPAVTATFNVDAR